MSIIRQYREARKLSLARLSELTDISAQQLNRLEKGERRLNEDNIRRIAEAFGCDPKDLLGEESHNTVAVPVLHSVDSSTGGRVATLEDGYNLSLRAGDKLKNAALEGMVVEGDFHRQYPAGTELIFASMHEALKAKLVHGQMVLVEIAEANVTQRVIGTLKVARGIVTLEFEGKDYRSTLSTVYHQNQKAGIGLSDIKGSGFDAMPEVPLSSRNMKIVGVLVKSIRPE